MPNETLSAHSKIFLPAWTLSKIIPKGPVSVWRQYVFKHSSPWSSVLYGCNGDIQEKCVLGASRRTIRRPSTVRALFLAYSVATATSFIPGKLTLSSCVTVGQVKFKTTSISLCGFMNKGTKAFCSDLASCFFQIWRVFIWLILESTAKLLYFHVLKR